MTFISHFIDWLAAASLTELQTLYFSHMVLYASPPLFTLCRERSVSAVE